MHDNAYPSFEISFNFFMPVIVAGNQTSDKVSNGILLSDRLLKLTATKLHPVNQQVAYVSTYENSLK